MVIVLFIYYQKSGITYNYQNSYESTNLLSNKKSIQPTSYQTRVIVPNIQDKKTSDSRELLQNNKMPVKSNKIPGLVDQKILEYIKNARKKGCSDILIKAKLKSVGWSEELINQELNNK